METLGTAGRPCRRHAVLQSQWDRLLAVSRTALPGQLLSSKGQSGGFTFPNTVRFALLPGSQRLPALHNPEKAWDRKRPPGGHDMRDTFP